jgi:uncharacterized membrane protein
MKRPMKTLCLLMSACFIAATSTITFAQDGSSTGKCSFQTLNIPAPANNLPVARALNDVGGIVGQYLASDFRSHGFLLYQGKLTTFMFPGSTDTEPRDVNTTGTIVGDYIQGGSGHAFMVHSGGFKQITIPGFPNAVVTANGVNDNGDVVGQFNSNGTASGYLLRSGKLTTLSFPGAAGGTNPTSINNQGVIVGTYFLSSEDPAHGFMWKAGVFSNLNPPDGGGHSQPTKISNAGDVVGTYVSTADGLQHGFSFDQGRYTKIDVPGLQSTGIDAVNKFDNVIAEAIQGTKTLLFKGFCSAVF